MKTKAPVQQKAQPAPAAPARSPDRLPGTAELPSAAQATHDFGAIDVSASRSTRSAAQGAGPLQLQRGHGGERHRAERAQQNREEQQARLDSTRERLREKLRRRNVWQQMEPEMRKARGANPSDDQLAEIATTRSLVLGGVDARPWEMFGENEQAALQARFQIGEKTPDLVLNPGTRKPSLGDIFTVNAFEDAERRQALSSAVGSGSFAEEQRRSLRSIYVSSIAEQAHTKLTKYAKGTTAVVNVSQVPWAHPETMRRVIADRFGGEKEIPGPVTAVAGDRILPLFPRPAGSRPGKDPLHYKILKQAEEDEKKKLADRAQDPLENENEGEGGFFAGLGM